MPTIQMTSNDERSEGRHVLTIGRLVATKGHWTILEAARAALERDETLRWTIIGGGELHEALRNDSRYRALHPRLMLAGPMDHSGALRKLSGASAFVLPCEPNERGDSDGIPVALMEAMALRVPVITTEVGGIGELVIDGVTGFIVPPRDSAALVRALSMVLYGMNRQKLERIRSSGLAKVQDAFSADTEASKLIEFIRSAAKVDLLGALATA
jgi:glycosyltransferase involved in cell wall biosynthesis